MRNIDKLVGTDQLHTIEGREAVKERTLTLEQVAQAERLGRDQKSSDLFHDEYGYSGALYCPGERENFQEMATLTSAQKRVYDEAYRSFSRAMNEISEHPGPERCVYVRSNETPDGPSEAAGAHPSRAPRS